MTKLLISIEMDHFIYDLEEAHAEIGMLLHETLLLELAKTGTINRANWLVSADTVGIPNSDSELV